MNELTVRPIGYTKDATLYGYQQKHIVDMETLGRLMYPNAKNPAQQIQNLFQQNKRRFTERDTVLLKVDSAHLWRPAITAAVIAGGQAKEIIQKREMRFFTLPYGVIKICKFSQSPHAVEVLERMIDMHDAFIKGALARYDKGIAGIAALPKCTRGIGKFYKEEADKTGEHPATIRRRADRMRKGEPITRNCPGMKKGYCHKKHTDSKETALQLMAEGKSVREIDGIVRAPLATLYRWRKEVII